MAEIHEELMAPGRWALPMNYDPEVEALALAKTHVLIYHHEELVWCGVLAEREIDLDAHRMVFGGPGVSWWLGDREKGPPIADRQWVSGENRLLDGGFELGFSSNTWSRTDESYWVPGAGDAHAGSAGAAYVNGSPLKDDVLTSAQRFPSKPGEQHALTAYARRGPGTKGRVRLRAVFEGRFDTPNLLVNGDLSLGTENGWAPNSVDIQIVNDPANALPGSSNVIRVGPITKQQIILNPFFTDGLAYWDNEHALGNWYHDTGTSFDGTASITTDGDALFPDLKYVESDYTEGGDPPVTGYPVAPGEEYDFEGRVKAHGATPSGAAALFVLLGGEDLPLNGEWVNTQRAQAEDGPVAGGWQRLQTTVNVGEGQTRAIPVLVVESAGVDSLWSFDQVTMTRIKGNRETFGHIGFFVTPEKRYRVVAMVRFDDAVVNGEVWPVLRFDSDNWDEDILMDGPHVSAPEGNRSWSLYDWEFEPPSGTDIMSFGWVGGDIYGGPVWIGSTWLAAVESDEVVFDSLTPQIAADWVAFGQFVTTPVGATHVHVDVVAEAGAEGWLVDDVVFVRSDVEASTVNQVVQSILVDDYGVSNTVVPGVLAAGEQLRFDFYAVDTTPAAVLGRVVRAGLGAELLEWRVNPDRTLDVGPPSVIFQDLTQPSSEDPARPVVITKRDALLKEPARLKEDSWDTINQVKLLGGDALQTNGSTAVQSAIVNAENGEVDWYGNNFRRRLVAQDAAADHPVLVDALAQHTLEQNNHTAKSVELVMTNARFLPKISVGDTVGLDLPEAGLSDPTKFGLKDGELVQPQSVRVLAARHQLGPDYSAVLRTRDGDLIPLVGVVWEDASATTLTVGDYRPEFEVDPDGGPSHLQLLDYRRHLPR